ncbi:MAG: LysR family transcriptional regulator [Gammaproteobacteria bacterium]|nr:LysR family transcriptional regulator [Gammaproteobacteria bacterium]
MNVTLRQLRVFEAVARHLSFTRAAEELFLTQPAVSMQVKQLEQHVELPLFEQVGKKVSLTEAGREMQFYSRAIMQLLDEADDVLDGLRGGEHGHLGLAVPSTANQMTMNLLAAFRRRNPAFTFSIDITNREGLLRRLELNECDLVIMGRPPEEVALEAVAFMENPLVVIAAPDHPLAERRRIDPASLRQETFVIREPGSGTRIAMERFFAEHGWHPDQGSGMEMTSNEAIKQAVEAGLGLGIVSLHTLDVELAAGRLKVLDVKSFPILRHWYIVQRKGKRLSAVASRFREFVIAEAGSVWRIPGEG